MNRMDQLLDIEKALLKNEALISSLCAKWHGKPENIGKDIFLIASTIVTMNTSDDIVEKLKHSKEYKSPFDNL